MKPYNGHIISFWPIDVHTDILGSVLEKNTVFLIKRERFSRYVFHPPPSAFLEYRCKAGAAIATYEHNEESHILKMAEQKVEGARVLDGIVEPSHQPRRAFCFNLFYVRKNLYLFLPM